MYGKVFHENMSLMKKKMAQPALHVFGGCFKGIQKVLFDYDEF